jgi:hypothetical protein
MTDFSCAVSCHCERTQTGCPPVSVLAPPNFCGLLPASPVCTAEISRHESFGVRARELSEESASTSTHSRVAFLGSQEAAGPVDASLDHGRISPLPNDQCPVNGKGRPGKNRCSPGELGTLLERWMADRHTPTLVFINLQCLPTHTDSRVQS